ncbi:MAG: succinate dehydrogenase assembly factor 2 [Marinicellaceae bacterium]
MTERLKIGYLQWRCRRGTKELDVVLRRFLDNNYDSLTDDQLRIFDDLLNTQDTILWYWLSLKEMPETESFKKMVLQITNND